MKFYVRNLLLVLISICLCSGINLPKVLAMAGASPEGGVSTAANQLLQLGNDITAILQRATMIANQLQQLRTYSHFSKHEWGRAMESLLGLHRVIEDGYALAFSLKNVDQKFRLIYPGYLPSENFKTAYERWTNVTNDTVVSSLIAAGFQSRQFANEEVTMKTLRGLSNQAVGQTQAIQAGNLISNQIVGQLQKLRQLVMSQIQAYASFSGFIVNERAGTRASANEFFKIIPRLQGGRRY